MIKNTSQSAKILVELKTCPIYDHIYIYMYECTKLLFDANMHDFRVLYLHKCFTSGYFTAV